MPQYDRFNLEAEIMHVWQTKDDLDAIAERLIESPNGPMTEDEIGNLLVGLSELHNTRCMKLFQVFETMVKEEIIKFVQLSDLSEKGFNESNT